MSVLTFNDLRPQDTDSLLELQQKQSIASVAQARLKPALLNGGNPLFTLNDIDGMAASEQAGARIDLLADDHQSLPAIVLVVKTTNGQGATPTSPGPGHAFVLSYAFSHNLIDLMEALEVLENRTATLSCALPDTDESTAAGQRETASARIPVTGRYLYTWWAGTGFGGDALIDVTVHALAVG
ncbi:MAG: hypothetical protein AB1705_22175 [Verrucomicrobiota bacterium]